MKLAPPSPELAPTGSSALLHSDLLIS